MSATPVKATGLDSVPTSIPQRLDQLLLLQRRRSRTTTMIGLALSFVWLGVVALYLAQRLVEGGDPLSITMRDGFLGTLATSAPLALIWLICLYVRQMQSLATQLAVQRFRLESSPSAGIDLAEKRVHSAAVTLLARADELSRAESVTSDKLRSMIDDIQGQTRSIQHVVTTMTDSARAIGTDYGHLIERLQGASGAVDEQRKALSELVGSAGELLTHSEKQASTWSERMTGVVRLARDASEGLGEVREAVNRQAQDLQQSIGDVGAQGVGQLHDLDQAIHHQLQKVQQSVATVLTDAEVLREGLQGTAVDLHNISQEVMQTTTQTSDALKLDHEQLASTLAEARALSGNVSERLKNHFGEFDRYLEQSLNQVDEVAALLGDEQGGIVIQLRTILSDLETCATRFTTQAANLVSASQGAADKSEELENRYRERHQRLFIEAASGMLEILNAHTLDVARMIGEDISDSDLRQFMSGDRSTFSRALAKRNVAVLSRVIGEEIRSSHAARETIVRFMGQFEEFLREAEIADPRRIVATSVLSSDLGRIYMILTHVMDS